jgi:hypothetical protein
MQTSLYSPKLTMLQIVYSVMYMKLKNSEIKIKSLLRKTSVFIYK